MILSIVLKCLSRRNHSFLPSRKVSILEIQPFLQLCKLSVPLVLPLVPGFLHETIMHETPYLWILDEVQVELAVDAVNIKIDVLRRVRSVNEV